MPRNKSEKGPQILQRRVLSHAYHETNKGVLVLAETPFGFALMLANLSGYLSERLIASRTFDNRIAAENAFGHFPDRWTYSIWAPRGEWEYWYTTGPYSSTYPEAPEWLAALCADARKD